MIPHLLHPLVGNATLYRGNLYRKRTSRRRRTTTRYRQAREGRHHVRIAEQTGLIVQRNSGGAMNFYIALRVPETWVVDSAIPFDSDSQTAPARLLELFKGWSDGLRLRDIIRAAEPNFILRRLVCMDPEMRWEGEGVTFLGDAAHVMSSFAGKGANLAIIDAAELGYALAGGDVKGEGKYASVREAVAAYEKRMFPRAEGAAKESALNMELFISDLVPMSAVDRMKEVISRGPGVP